MRTIVGTILFLAAGSAVARTPDTSKMTLEQLRAYGERAGWTFEVGETPISNLPAEQITGLKVPANWRDLAPFVKPPHHLTLPAKWDWRDEGVVSPIKDQALPQYCGSCWAFGTAASMESAIAIKTGRLPDLSEQQLVSCQPDYGSCSGGYFAFGLYKQKGANYEEDFLYTATNASCRTAAPQHEKAQSWAYVGSGNEPTVAELKDAIYTYGPIAVTVSASGAWNNYVSGVYNECNRNGTNHIVALVGWNDEDQAWIIKNSHGTVWGEEGYMRMKYTGTDGRKCNRVGESAAFVVYEPQ